MKIILINPSQYKIYSGFPAPTYTPLGLMYIAAVLEKSGNEVRIIDMDAERIKIEEVKDIIKSLQPRLVGITVVTPSYNKAVSLSQMIKEVSKDIYTVLGGMHPTILPEESIRPGTIDFVVKGEGEVTIKELVSCLEKDRDFRAIDGLVWKKNGNIITNKDRELIDNLDLVPFPARHLLDYHYYYFNDTESSNSIPIITSRGCPGECTFCSVRQMFSRRFRTRSPRNIVDEIEYLIQRYQPKEIHIWDDNFITQKERVFQIRDELKRRGIKIKFTFPNGIRIDCIDEEIIKTLKEMGVSSIAFGIESASQRILDKIKKRTSIQQIEAAYRLTKKYDIQTWAFFVLGLPLDDKYTIRKTINFAKRLNPDLAKFHILKPYPGTEIFDEFSRSGFIVDKNYDNYGFYKKPVHILPGLDRGDLLYWQKRAYWDFYFRPIKLLERLSRIESLYRLSSDLKMGVKLLKGLFLGNGE